MQAVQRAVSLGLGLLRHQSHPCAVVLSRPLSPSRHLSWLDARFLTSVATARAIVAPASAPISTPQRAFLHSRRGGFGFGGRDPSPSNSSSDNDSHPPPHQDEPKKVAVFRITPRRIRLNPQTMQPMDDHDRPVPSPHASAAALRRSRVLFTNAAKSEGEGESRERDGNDAHRGRFLRPFLFTAAFSVGSFCLAASLEYEWELTNQRSLTNALINQVQWLQQQFSLDLAPRTNPNPTFWDVLRNEWRDMPEASKTVAVLIAINCAVYLAWKIDFLLPFMTRNFLAVSTSGRALPMLLSTFSHYQFFHLASNMVVLSSFGVAVHEYLGKHQFLAFYLSSGVLASFVGHVAKNALGRVNASLGASGAIMALVIYFSSLFPHSHMSLIFLPSYSFEAWQATLGIIALDLAGLVLRWQLFDHAVHLAGAATGWLYAAEGELVWDSFCTYWLEHYVQLKREWLRFWASRPK